MKQLLFLVLFSSVAASCFSADPNSSIVAATKSYVSSSSEIKQMQVTIEKVEGDYARAKVKPTAETQTDEAWVFLKKKNGTWTGLTMGTFFEAGDYKVHGIPPSLWLK